MFQKYKKIISIILLTATLFVFRPQPAHAGEWGGAMLAAIWKQTVEQMVKSIQDTILAQAKQAAIRVIQNRVLSLMKTKSGSSQGLSGMLISNWQSFVYGTASSYSSTVVSDFFTNLKTGANNYEKNYILTPASNALTTNVFSKVPDLHDYIDDPTDIFTSKTTLNWKVWLKAAEPQNDLATTYLKAQALKEAAYQQKINAKWAEGVSGNGYASKVVSAASSTGSEKFGTARVSSKSTETITMPGAMMNNFLNETQNMGIRLVTYAKSIPEVVVNLVVSSVTQMVNQGITKSFSKIQ